jgi:hypothetical protein
MLPAWAIQLIFFVSLIGGAYWYYTSSQAKIAQLRDINLVLEMQAEVNERALEGMRSAMIFKEKVYNDLAKNMGEAEAEKTKLINIFQEHDLERLSIAKPNLIEKILNEGTKNSFNELESITDK